MKLCYIEGPWAYFTSQSLDKQWGDDWNDAPYEHNAGTPYECRKGQRFYDIRKIAFDGPFDRPCDIHPYTPRSVEMVNNRMVPWLSVDQYRKTRPENDKLFAGASIEEFGVFIRTHGGEVYLPRDYLLMSWSDFE